VTVQDVILHGPLYLCGYDVRMNVCESRCTICYRYRSFYKNDYVVSDSLLLHSQKYNFIINKHY